MRTKSFTIKSGWSKILLCPVIALWVSLDVLAQDRLNVSGTVTGPDGHPVAGVTVSLEGTNSAAATDEAGRYAINNVRSDGTLVFKAVGYETTSVGIGGKTVINVELAYGEEALDEVVVTALGIKREERSLGYSVGRVSGEELNRVVNENVLSGVAGKVPGVAVSSTGGTGSSVSMVIRGATSLSSDNQPLFVVDGVPIANTLNNVSQVGNDNRVDYGNAISSLNPDDIESVSILTGPSA